MTSSSGGDFDFFGAIYEAPDLLELVVQQFNGRKNDLRLACSRLRAAVDACVTKLTWTHSIPDADPSVDFVADPGTIPSEWIFWFDQCVIPEYNGGAKGAKNMAVLGRCPRLQTVSFNRSRVADLSPLATCFSLRRVIGFAGDNLAPLAALTHLEHLSIAARAGNSLTSLLSPNARRSDTWTAAGLRSGSCHPCPQALRRWPAAACL